MSFRSVGTARERWFVAEAEVVAALREYCLMKFDMKALARDCCRDGTGKRRFLQEGISFLGQAFSEPRLLALGYAFEQVTKAASCRSTRRC